MIKKISMFFLPQLVVFLIFLGGCSRAKRQPLRVLQDRSASSMRVTRPRVLICSSNGGGAHGSAVQALQATFKDRYEVATAFVIRDVLDELDPVRWVTGDRLNGEDLYNFFLANGSAWFANALARYGCHHVVNKEQAMRQAFGEFLDINDPDLVISVIPYVDAALLGACRERNIPFMIVPCDYNGYNYMNGLDLRKTPYHLFRYAVPLDDELVWYELARGNVPREQMPVTGFLVRPEFDVRRVLPADQVRARFAISSDRPVVMILMGGAGGSRAYGYIKALKKSKKKIHIVVCAGRNEKLKKRLSKMRMAEGQFMSVIGFTDQIANLMSVSDVLITKPGPGTLAEALALKVPMVLDVPSRVLYWEEMNINLVQKYKVGAIARSFTDGARLVNLLLDHPSDRVVLESRMTNVSVARASERILAVVEELLELKNRE